MRALVQRQRLDLVLAQLARLGLEARRDVGLQRAVLALNAANLELEPRRVRLTAIRRQQEVALLWKNTTQLWKAVQEVSQTLRTLFRYLETKNFDLQMQQARWIRLTSGSQAL